MSKSILVALALAAACLVGCAQIPPGPPDYALPRAAVHFIDTASSTGSGVMLAPGSMLTASHVVSDTDEVTIDHKPEKVKVIRLDKTLDLALLEVPTQCPCVALAGDLKIDELAIAVGYPMANQIMTAQIVTEGRIQQLRDDAVIATAPIGPGNSGGGLFVLRNHQWKFAGIEKAVANYCRRTNCDIIPHLTMAISQSRIADFLAEIPNKGA